MAARENELRDGPPSQDRENHQKGLLLSPVYLMEFFSGTVAGSITKARSIVMLQSEIS